MKKLLFFVVGLILLGNVIAAGNTLYFSLTTNFVSGKLLKQSVFLIQSDEILDFSKKTGDYKVALISFEGNILFETYFDVTADVVPEPLKEWFDEKGNQVIVPEKHVETKLKDVSSVIFLPYFKNAKNIEIYNKKSELELSVDVSEFATCNLNKVCDFKESHELCPEDCPFAEEKIKLSWWERIFHFLKNLFK